MNTIDKIRAEIERRIKEYDAIIESQPDSNRSERAAWKWAEDKSLLSFIESLPEETDNEEPNRPKLSDNSLEDEMINYWGRIPDDKDLIDTARHFALWQKEQMMNEWLQDRDGCFWDGVAEGKKAMKEQMEVDLEKASRNVYESWMGGAMNDVRRDMVELGKVLNARKEESK
jgi:hypothetical protein